MRYTLLKRWNALVLKAGVVWVTKGLKEDWFIAVANCSLKQPCNKLYC